MIFTTVSIVVTLAIWGLARPIFCILPGIQSGLIIPTTFWHDLFHFFQENLGEYDDHFCRFSGDVVS